VFTVDKNGCNCTDPRILEATPPSKYAQRYTFKDALSNPYFDKNKMYWIKEEAPVYIEYIVNGYTFIRIKCQDYPGFQCEKSK